MESTVATEQHQERLTAMQRLRAQAASFGVALLRTALLALVMTPVLLTAILTVDLPLRFFDSLVGQQMVLRPSNWLSWGGFVMAAATFLAILMTRRFGGDEASRAVTAAWTIAAIVVFFELSYLAPALEDGDLPSARFTVAFVASAMIAQYIGINIYDISRGGERWWRAPLVGAMGGFTVGAFVYFPVVYWGAGAPWLNWLVGDIAVKAAMAFAFIGIYGLARKTLRPRGGFGGI
ncbi:MAG: VUT family protein [Pseudomonadota bacterium]